MQEGSQSFNSSGISVERTKELLGQPDLSNEEAECIRDECRILAEIIFEQWLNEKRRNDSMK
jgi:hypothetical protein